MPLITTPSASAVIGCAIAVHRELGAGLFESVYQPCLADELYALLAFASRNRSSRR